MITHIARRTLLAAGGSLALVALTPGLSLAEGAPGEEAIEGRLQQYEARFNRGDPEAVARLFGKEVIYYDPTGQVHEGRNAVEAYYRRNLEAGFSDMAIDTIEIEVLDNTAYDIARYTVSGPQGEPLVGYHLAILAKEDGKWRVQRTLVNAKMPEPPAE